MKFYSTLTIIILFFSIAATAQSDFEAGLIKKNNGDTLSVLIKKVSGRIAPREVEYETTDSPGIRSLSAMEVKWFRYNNGEWFFSYNGPVESSSLDVNSLDYDSVSHTVNDTMFLRAVLISKASLFYARDRKDRLHLFYSKDNSQIAELIYKKYYKDEVVVADYLNTITKRAIMASELYKGQLIQSFQDCPYVSSGILSRAMSYAKNDLLILFEEYNRCKSARVIYKEDKDKGKVELLLQAGPNLTTAKFTSTYLPWQGIDFGLHPGFELGLGVNWLLPRLNNRFGFYNELLLNAQHVKGEKNGDQLTLDAIIFKWIIAARLRGANGKTAVPIFDFGFSNNLTLYHNESLSSELLASMFKDYRTYNQGLILGAGIQRNRVAAELRFEKTNGFSPYVSLRTIFTTWYFQFGFTL